MGQSAAGLGSRTTSRTQQEQQQQQQPAGMEVPADIFQRLAGGALLGGAWQCVRFHMHWYGTWMLRCFCCVTCRQRCSADDCHPVK
jgi:hypothetical protein